MGGKRDDGARGGGRSRRVRRLWPAALLLAVAAAGAVAWTLSAEPEWYQRARYPLRYESIVRAHARNYELPPTLLAAVIYTELLRQSHSLIPEGINLSHKLMRIQARPKILLSSTFEEAWRGVQRTVRRR